MKWNPLPISVLCWTGRALALGLFLVWGAFFVEHLQEWFLHPDKGFPPDWVWLLQLAHLAMLVGLAALWCWPTTGSVLTVLGSLGLFGSLAIGQGTAGKPYLLLVTFLAVTIVPALLTLGCWFGRAHALAAADTAINGID